MTRALIALCLSAAILSACATGADTEQSTAPQPQASPAAEQQPRAVPVPDDDAPRIAELTEKNLEPGQCGMLLWTVDAGEPSLIFRNVDGQTAEMMIDGTLSRLTLTSESGERRFGASAEQQFMRAAGTDRETRVKVSVRFGIPFEGGTYVESGIITLRNHEGWERVTPVAGLAGCRN